jgi:uncharacterized Zn finger protein
MSYWGWKPYVPVAARRKKAEAAAAKAKTGGATLSPVAASRGAIARTFWGRAWCENLERYSDFSNRLPRGRTYLRNGSVIDLVIGQGEVRAQVVGSSLYRVDVRVAAVGEKHWKAIGADCAGSIDSMVELLQGRFSQAVMERLARPGDGLFPTPQEIEFTCSCPDWASMCKHVAAVLYGVGARLDQRPELLFQLRRVDGSELIAQAGAGVARPTKQPAKAKVLDDSALADVFGIEMADASPAPRAVRPAAGRGRKAATTAAKAAAKVEPKSGRTSASASKADSGRTKPAVAQPPRTAAKAKAPAKTRRPAAAAKSLARAIAKARRKTPAPAGATAQPKPKRRSRA